MSQYLDYEEWYLANAIRSYSIHQFEHPQELYVGLSNGIKIFSALLPTLPSDRTTGQQFFLMSCEVPNIGRTKANKISLVRAFNVFRQKVRRREFHSVTKNKDFDSNLTYRTMGRQPNTRTLGRILLITTYPLEVMGGAVLMILRDDQSSMKFTALALVI